jgi:hypothetical protein
MKDEADAIRGVFLTETVGLSSVSTFYIGAPDG